MSAVLAALKAQAAQAAATGPDMTEVQKGGSTKLLPAGYALGRMVEYVELGKQPQEFAGKAKDPAMEIQLGFALWGEGISDADGTPYIVRPYSMAISRNEKAKAFKLFARLNWKGAATHYAEFLGEAFLIPIVHVAKSKTDATLVSRIDTDNILPPLDALSKQPYNVPEAPDDLYRLFLWEYPTIEGWKALHIEGTYDDGKSKNRIQETMLGASDFAGSPLEQLLMSAGIPALPTGNASGSPAAAPVGALPPGAGYSPAFSAPAQPAAPGVAPAASPLVQPTPPAIAAALPVAPVAVPAGPAIPIAPTPAAMPIAPTTSHSSPA